MFSIKLSNKVLIFSDVIRDTRVKLSGQASKYSELLINELPRLACLNFFFKVLSIFYVKNEKIFHHPSDFSCNKPSHLACFLWSSRLLGSSE